MGTSMGIVLAKEADFMIHRLLGFELFGQKVYLTTTHVSILIVCAGLIILALVTRIKLRDTEKPGGLQNVMELAVEMLDNMVKGSLDKYAF